MIRITEPGIDLVGGGLCPVQAEGTVDGHFAYFRARGTTWQFTIAASSVSAIAGGEEPGVLFDRIRTWCPGDDHCNGFCAGYMPDDVAEKLIREQIAVFRAGRDQAAQLKGA